jgi:ribonuclease D
VTPLLIDTAEGLTGLAATLASQPDVAVDTESNSLHAYRERVCLLQFSIPGADFIVDPLAVTDLSPLATLFSDPGIQKIFHAAEYDLICLRRDYGFTFANLFDTMSAARTLGWPQVGLAAILAARFDVTMNKKYQRADWKRRPLTPEQLAYASLDTHHLIALRDIESQALADAGLLLEAQEDFERLARGAADIDDDRSDRPTGFWRVKGAFDLAPQQAAVLKAVFEYREQQAERIDRPPFMVMSESTLIDIARRAPLQIEDLQAIPGMTPDQLRRHGQRLLLAVREGLDATPQQAAPPRREPEDVQDRFDRLHTWRKNRAKLRGVESDVIIPKTTLWDLARRPPRSRDELAQVADFGRSRREQYGDEILALLSRPRPAS